MNDIVNWESLEKTINSFNKTARSEIVNPADRTYLEQQNTSSQVGESESTSNDESISETSRESYVRNPTEEKSPSERIIEVENVKGKMKQIDPDDYSVQILANDDRIIYTGMLSKMASGMYKTIMVSHGSDKMLQCILKDYIRNPNMFIDKKLNFIQAKTIITSLKKTLGHIPSQSLNDICDKLDTNSKLQIDEWLKNK